MSPYQEAALESYTFHNEMDASEEDGAPASALGLPRGICPICPCRSTRCSPFSKIWTSCLDKWGRKKMWRTSIFSFVSFLICSPVCWCCVCLQNHHRHKTIEKRFYFCHMNARILLSAFDLFQYHSLDTYCFVSWALQTHPEYILNTLWKIQILDLTSANFI